MTSSLTTKILIAEDTPVQGKKLKFYLEKLGYEVHWCLDGKAALNELKYNPDIQLVISDVQMPVMDGIELLYEVRSLPQFQSLPFIVLTTLEEVDVKIRALELGASDFLNKPFVMEELEIRARNLLQLYHYHRLLEDKNESLAAQLIEKNKTLEKNLLELQESHEALKAMQTEIVRMGKMTTLGMLGAGVAHEINNPLTIISAHNARILKLLKTGAPDVAAITQVSLSIDVNVKRISSIVKQLRRLSKKTNEQVTLTPLDLNSFITELQDLFIPLARSSSVEIIMNLCAEELPTEVNETTYSQCILNLIQNACDAMETSPSKVLRVTSRKDQSWAYIDVTDTGTGIPLAIQEKVFDAFFTTKDPAKGTGLGLALCYTFMKEMEGDISFRTGPDGTTFTLKLPLKSEQQKAVA